MLVANLFLFGGCGGRGCFTLPYLKSGNSLFVAKFLTLAEILLTLATQESVSG